MVFLHDWIRKALKGRNSTAESAKNVDQRRNTTDRGEPLVKRRPFIFDFGTQNARVSLEERRVP